MIYKDAISKLREYIENKTPETTDSEIDGAIRILVDGFNKRVYMRNDDAFVMADIYEAEKLSMLSLIAALYDNIKKPGSIPEEVINMHEKHILEFDELLSKMSYVFGYRYNEQEAIERMHRKLNHQF